MKKLVLLFIVVLLVGACEQPPVEVTVEVNEMSYVYLNWIGSHVSYNDDGCIRRIDGSFYALEGLTSLCDSTDGQYTELRLHSFSSDHVEPYAILDYSTVTRPNEIRTRSVNLFDYEYQEKTSP